MPSGSEKDVLMIIAEEGGETTFGRIVRTMPCYSAQYVRCVVRSLGTHDYLDWLAGGKILLTEKGKQSLRLSEEQWQEIDATRERKEKERAEAARTMLPPMVGSELEALRKVQQLRRATKEALSQEMNVSTAQAALLFQHLIKRGYISGNLEVGYQITPEGQGFLAG